MRFFRWAVFRGAMISAAPFWFLCLAIVAALVASRYRAARGDGWRYAGTALQVFGLFAVGWGLRDMRRYFNLPSLCSDVEAWWRKLRSAFGPPGPPIRTVTSDNLVRSVTYEHSRLRPAPDATIPERLAAVEARINLLQIEQKELVDTHGSKLAALDKKVQDETRQRELGDGDANRTIKDVAVGGFPVALVGLVCLFFGVILTSIPSELAALFGVG